MPTFKKRFRLKTEQQCDFCRRHINAGELVVCTTVRDLYGKYTLRFHPECDRTSDLNETFDREW